MRNGTRILAFPGSFDLFTNGHLWVVHQASLLAASKVIVLIAHNPSKQGMFTIDERVEMIEVACQEAGLSHIEVSVNESEYTVEWCEANEARMIRGIRNAADLEYERMVNNTNSGVLGGEQTLFLLPPEDVAMISSSYVKSLIGPIGWQHQVRKFLPDYAYHMLIQKWLTKKWNEAADLLRINQWPVKDSNKPLKDLFCRYISDDRHYHTLTHLVHGITELSRVELTDFERAKLTFAFFYHDAVQGKGGEEYSAALAVSELTTFMEYNDAAQIADYVRATDHSKPREDLTDLEKTMISVDLAILGRPTAEYDIYAAQVRKEYQQYTDVDYAVGRCKVLQSMIDLAKADQLYPDYNFRWKYNRQAWQNMQRELVELETDLPVVDDTVVIN